MNKSNKGFNLYFLLIIGLTLLTIYANSDLGSRDDYTRDAFMTDLEAGNVMNVVINPNQETPTGYLDIELKSGEERMLYVTDVTEIESVLREMGVDPYIEAVPQDNWFLTSVLPILIVGVLMIFVLVIMTGQGSGGGSGNKMMNFGKSRAKMSTIKTPL